MFSFPEGRKFEEESLGLSVIYFFEDKHGG